MDGGVFGWEGEGLGGGGEVGGRGWFWVGDLVVQVDVCLVGWVGDVPVEKFVEEGELDFWWKERWID